MNNPNQKVTLLPIGNRLLLRRLDDDGPGGGVIKLPDSAKEDQQSQRCEVVVTTPTGMISTALDDGHRREKMLPMTFHTTVPVNSIVHIAKYKGYSVTVNGEDLVIVDAADVLGIELPAVGSMSEAASEPEGAAI